MTDQTSTDTLEGRILAHRRLLAQMLAVLPAREWDTLSGWLAESASLQDGQEDPGAVPAEGLALGLSITEEYRQIAELAEGLRNRK